MADELQSSFLEAADLGEAVSHQEGENGWSSTDSDPHVQSEDQVVPKEESPQNVRCK